ncbi:MAG: hypothetical protein BMS9Abin05_2716 [Rhodothermia bacterium]|nr:MAG: hypothetical protein BMS9Abin05_2716 [Rhodothermia bacterium]
MNHQAMILSSEIVEHAKSRAAKIVGAENVRDELRLTIGEESSYFVWLQQLVAAVYEREGRQQACAPRMDLLFQK